MAEGKDEEVGTYVTSESGVGSLRSVKGVDCLIFISNTKMHKELW